MYNPSDINNIDYVLIISLAKLLCRRKDLTVTSTINRHISGTVLYVRLLTSSVITEICEVTVGTIFIIVHLSNTLQRLLAVVRTSTYNNTACILRIVSVFL